MSPLAVWARPATWPWSLIAAASLTAAPPSVPRSLIDPAEAASGAIAADASARAQISRLLVEKRPLRFRRCLSWVRAPGPLPNAPALRRTGYRRSRGSVGHVENEAEDVGARIERPEQWASEHARPH